MSQADDLLRLILEQNARDVGGMGLQHVASGIPSYAPSPVPAQATEAAMPGAQAPALTPAHLSLLQRLAMGVQVPNTPLSPNRGSARAQLFLRGLVGGFKGSQAPGLERILGKTHSGGRTAAAADPLDEEYKRLRNEGMRRSQSAYDAAGEKRIDSYVTNSDPNSMAARKLALDERALAARERELGLREKGKPASGRGGRSGGGRGGKITYSMERGQIGARARAEIARLTAVATNMAEQNGRKLKDDPQATMFLQRKKMETNAQLQQLLDDLDARYNVTHNTAGNAPTGAGALVPSGSFDDYVKSQGH